MGLKRSTAARRFSTSTTDERVYEHRVGRDVDEAITAHELVDWDAVPGVSTAEAAAWNARLIDARDTLLSDDKAGDHDDNPVMTDGGLSRRSALGLLGAIGLAGVPTTVAADKSPDSDTNPGVEAGETGVDPDALTVDERLALRGSIETSVTVDVPPQIRQLAEAEAEDSEHDLSHFLIDYVDIDFTWRDARTGEVFHGDD